MQREQREQGVAVFWDFETARVKSLVSGYQVAKGLRDVANAFGLVKSIRAYLDVANQTHPKFPSLRRELHASGITIVDCPTFSGKDIADKAMIVDMLTLAMDETSPRTIIVATGDRDLSYALAVLRLRRFKIVLVCPSDAYESLLMQADDNVNWNSQVLGLDENNDPSGSSSSTFSSSSTSTSESSALSYTTPSPPNHGIHRSTEPEAGSAKAQIPRSPACASHQTTGSESRVPRAEKGWPREDHGDDINEMETLSAVSPLNSPRIATVKGLSNEGPVVTVNGLAEGNVSTLSAGSTSGAEHQVTNPRSRTRAGTQSTAAATGSGPKRAGLATIKIQTWWRGIQVRRLAENIRREEAVRRLQTAIRAHTERKRFLDIRRGVTLVQSRIRGMQARHRFVHERKYQAATLLQSLFRGMACHRSYRSDVRHVIYLQSCIRRRYARRELEALMEEARTLSKYQEISYELENKAVELTQSLRKRSEEEKQAEAQLVELKQQTQQWINRHEESDARLKQALARLQTAEAEVARKEELLQAKLEVKKKLEEVTTQLAEKEEIILKLTDEISRQTTQIEAQRTASEASPVRTHEDSSVIATLKNEVSSLREQLNRANALNALTRGSRADQPSLSPTFAPTLRIADPNGTTANGNAAENNRHQHRHSSAGVFGLVPQENRTSTDEIMIDVRKLQATNPRAVSVAFNGEDNFMLFRGADGLPGIRDYEDPAEEKIRLMMDAKKLDKDILDGLIRGLKIPLPSLMNPSAVKEILFPANLINIVANEMWKYGLIAESERFLANVMQTIQAHVMSFQGEDAIIPGIFWLSNVHELLSFICVAESDMLQGIGPGEENAVRPFDWADYERSVSVVKHDLDSLEYNIYHTWMLETKKKLSKMVIPALIESQSLPGFTTSDGGGRLFNRLLDANSQSAYSMDDILNLLNKVWKSLKSYYMEESVVQQVVTELLKLIGVTSFNDLLMRQNFSSWKRAMQIQYNITRIEEWCKAHDMPEGTLQLEHLMQATKLLQLKKATPADIEIIYDVCWMLNPMQIQRMCTNYYVADYENPISPEILRVVASRVQANDRNDHLLLSPETKEVGPYELPLPRDVSGLETYVPAYLNVSHLRRLAALVL